MRRTENVELTVLCLIHRNDNYLLQNRLKDALIEKWLRNKNTIEFLGIWEEMYNVDFNVAAYEEIMLEAGLNRFIMSVKKWGFPHKFKGYCGKGRTVWRDIRI